MADPLPPPPNPEVDLDKALEEMDPTFSAELGSIREVAPATDVQIDQVGGELDMDDDVEEIDGKSQADRPKFKWYKRVRLWFGQKLVTFIIWVRGRVYPVLKKNGKALAIYLYTNGKRLSIEGFKASLQGTKTFLKWFGNLSGLQKLGLFAFIAIASLTVIVISANLKGHWVPEITKPMLTSFEPVANEIFEYNPNEKLISFLRAFPQDPEIFLFEKMKVNLRRTSEHSNPMGAFEMFAQVDSHETAVELQARQTEIRDIVQRVFESQSYNELVSELGKNRLKGLIKKEIDRILTQGWIVDIYFKMFVLKP